jgi:hypothetical protein
MEDAVMVAPADGISVEKFLRTIERLPFPLFVAFETTEESWFDSRITPGVIPPGMPIEEATESYVSIIDALGGTDK